MSNQHHPKNVEESEDNQLRPDIYPKNEDIYNNAIKEADIDPANPAKMKTPNEMPETEERNEKDFEAVKTGADLDVPGAELDDQEEAIGSEDEENNYYSIGGDNHTGLEEDKG